MMGPQWKKSLREKMWRNLPVGVLERVFTFLPIASLCRFRTLSKEWNRFISSPSFKHAGASKEDYALIMPRWGRLEGGWVVLDVARKRYFNLSDAFLTKHVQEQGLLDAAGVRRVWFKTCLAATDGGLICVWYFFTGDYTGLFVCNPVTKTVRHLPQAPGALWNRVADTVVMATARSSMEYEIFIVNTHMFYRAERRPFEAEFEAILVYESKTGSWRTAPYQPISYEIWWNTLTLFNNTLYCIIDDDLRDFQGLVSYDKETGVVSRLRDTNYPWGGINFPYSRRLRLVVCKARLFCVVPEINNRHVCPWVKIFEIDVVKWMSTRLTRMLGALVRWVLGRDLDHNPNRKPDFFRMKPR